MDIKTILGEKYVKCFWPNSVRLEDIDWDWEKMYRCIYINGERVDTAPLCATRDEAEMRLQELCERYGVEKEQYIRKPLDQLRNKEKWKSMNTIDSLEKLEQGESHGWDTN